MKFNLQRVMELIKKDAAQNLSILNLDYSIEEDRLTVSGEAGYTNPDCDFDIIFMIWADGDCSFSAYFGEIEESLSTLKLVNKFNDANAPFKAYISEDVSDLTLDYDFIDFDEIEKFDHLLSQIIDTLTREIETPEMRRLLSYIS